MWFEVVHAVPNCAIHVPSIVSATDLAGLHANGQDRHGTWIDSPRSLESVLCLVDHQDELGDQSQGLNGSWRGPGKLAFEASGSSLQAEGPSVHKKTLRKSLSLG